MLKRKNISTSRQLCDALLGDTGVAILPGSDFGRPEGELTARLAFVDFDGAAALKNYPQNNALDSGYPARNCGPTLEAVDRIVSWLEAL